MVHLNGDTCKILFYKGTGDVDVTFTDVLPTIKNLAMN